MRANEKFVILGILVEHIALVHIGLTHITVTDEIIPKTQTEPTGQIGTEHLVELVCLGCLGGRRIR